MTLVAGAFVVTLAVACVAAPGSTVKISGEYSVQAISAERK